jgi:predicted GIY-YIG superfamily endonuclease
MKIYYVYMLRCFDGTYYVGVTNNIERRFAQHVYGTFPSCYTCNKRPLILVHVSEFHSIDQAINWEKRLKSWSHRKKSALVERDWASVKHLAGKARYPRLERH